MQNQFFFSLSLFMVGIFCPERRKELLAVVSNMKGHILRGFVSFYLNTFRDASISLSISISFSIYLSFSVHLFLSIYLSFSIFFFIYLSFSVYLFLSLSLSLPLSLSTNCVGLVYDCLCV